MPPTDSVAPRTADDPGSGQRDSEMLPLDVRRLQADTFLALARLASRQYKRMQNLLEERDLEGISPAQSRALMILFQARGPLTARELSVRMGLSEVTVSRFVKALSAEGWVARERDPDDRRAWLLRTTEKARAALPRFIGVSNQLFDEVFDGFTADELAALAGVITRIRANLE